MKLIYIANMRLPTEKAHGLQIVQNCEAFAQAGADVTLWVPRRRNTPELRAVSDVYAHYGVQPLFKIRRLPCVDLLWLFPDGSRAEKLAFYLQSFTFALAALLLALFTPAGVFYSRDALPLLLLSFVRPRARLAYEPHRAAAGAGGRLQRWLLARVGSLLPITTPLRDALLQAGGDPAAMCVVHDGVQAARFAYLPEKESARAEIGWPAAAFIVLYMGRLHTLGMDKGLDTLVAAAAQVSAAHLALVGGPDEMAAALRADWLARGQDGARFLYAGQVPPGDVPRYLAAADVCVMPFPHTMHYAYYMSPMKLFEYMAAGRALVASDLPSIAEVVQHESTALLVPPGDAGALAAALLRLRDDAPLRERLGTAARAHVLAHYTWGQRAARILAHIARPPG